MSGTHVLYNGVELRDCETKLFDQKVTLDDARNLLTSRFHIRVESTVFGLYYQDYLEDAKAHPSTVVTENIESDRTATDRMHTIQKRLSQPRKDFWYATNGGRNEDVDEDVYQILVASTGEEPGTEDDPEFFKDVRGNDIEIRFQDGYHVSGGDSGKLPRANLVDVNRGPIPLDVQITQLFGGRAFRISFEIEVYRHLCLTQEDVETKPSDIGEDDNPEPNEFVISNTWSSEETCDEVFRRSKVVEGTLRVRDHRYWSQGFRSLCLPGLLPGYRRMSQRFASDPTNLVLKYRIEDKQAEAAPPEECVDWVMSHVDGSKNEFGMVERQIRIHLIGKPRVSKRSLLGVALRVLEARFPGAAAPTDDENVFVETRPVPFLREALIITQSSDKPEVELLCNVRQHIAGIGGFEDAIIASSEPLIIAGYNPDNWPAPRPYDADTPAGIFACYMQSPCNQWHGIPESQSLTLEGYDTDNNAPSSPDTAPNYWEEADYAEYLSPVPILETADVHRTDHISYPYTHVEIDTRYSLSHGRMVLPYSIPRDVNEAIEGADPVYASLAVFPVHAGVHQRVITVNATRHGRPPELPEPARYLVDPNGITEQLVGKSEIVLDAPQASSDQSHRVFSVQGKFTYALARPIENTEVYRSANNPALRTIPADNWLTGLSFFSRGRIEEHAARDSYGTVRRYERAPTQNPGHGYDPDDPPLTV
jgi:hypothetical protein